MMGKKVIGLVSCVSIETMKHVNCCRRANTHAKVISLGCYFSRDSDKHQQSHRMQRFACQNLMNRIDCDKTRCGGRHNASPLHGALAITPLRIGLSYYQSHWV